MERESKNHQTFEPCVVTGKVTENGNCYHHLKTRKAYPEHEFADWNRIPVTQEVHNWFHEKGLRHMADRFSAVRLWLKRHGWEFCQFRERWVHPAEDQEGEDC